MRIIVCLMMLLAPFVVFAQDTMSPSEIKFRIEHVEENTDKLIDCTDDLKTRLYVVESSVVYIKNELQEIKALIKEKNDFNFQELLYVLIASIFGGGMVFGGIKLPNVAKRMNGNGDKK